MKKHINYNDLIVNPENYRFDPVENQEQAIDLMLNEKGKEILNLAKDILRYGLDEAKDFRVLKIKNNKYLILDGNRRATAIKCLHDLSIIKDEKLRNGFSFIRTDTYKPIQNIQCTIYEDEERASRWINLDHTGKNNGVGQDPWGAPEKNRFSYRFEGKLSPAMQAVDIVEKVLNKKINTKKLKVSTINRILSNPDSRSILGVNLNRNKIIFNDKKNVAVKRLDRLLNKVIEDDIKVGQVYETWQTKEFMRKLFVDEAHENENIADTSAESETVNKNDVNSNQQQRSDYKPSGLFSSSKVPFKLGNRSLQKMYDELKDQNILEFPNAVHDLLRSFLECSLISFLKHEKIQKYEDVLIAKNRKPKTLSLTDILDYLSNNDSSPISDRSVRLIAKNLISDTHKNYSVDRMNQANHVETWFATEKEVKEIWEKMEPLFKVILNPVK